MYIKDGFSALDTISIGALTTVVADAGFDTSACVAGQIQLDGSASVNASSYTWSVLPSGANVGNAALTIVSPTTGVNTYVLTVSNNGCISTDTVLVNSLPQPFVDAGPDQSVLSGQTTTIGGSPTGNVGVSYTGEPSKGLGQPLQPKPVAGPAETTT